ncbi:hypothetical protein D3C72_2454340 [compost metagenome]
MQLFLHQVSLGDVASDGQHAVLVADRQRPARHLTEADLPIVAPDMAAEVADKTIALELVEHFPAFVQVDPDPEVEGRAIQ